MRGAYAAELAAKLAWVAAGLAIAWLAREMGVGRLQEPGPGMLACGLGILMAIVAGAGAIGLLRTRPAAEPAPRAAPSERPALRVAGLCLGLAAYIAVLTTVGFPLATFAFLCALLGVLAGLPWPRAAAIAAVAAAASYGVFRFGLGTQLPAGILG